MIEMAVPRVQREVVLKDERSEPHVVRRNRCSLFPELPEHSCVMVSRLVIREQDAHTVLQEKPPQGSFVLGLSTAESKARAQLAEHDEWKNDRFGTLQEFDRLDDSLA